MMNGVHDRPLNYVQLSNAWTCTSNAFDAGLMPSVWYSFSAPVHIKLVNVSRRVRNNVNSLLCVLSSLWY